MSFFDLYDEIYEEQFKKAYDFNKSGLTGDLEEDIKILRSTIQTLWDYQGQDLIGRGEIFLAKSNATISATEVLLHELLLKQKALK